MLLNGNAAFWTSPIHDQRALVFWLNLSAALRPEHAFIAHTEVKREVRGNQNLLDTYFVAVIGGYARFRGRFENTFSDV
jgi:hypothetical protein